MKQTMDRMTPRTEQAPRANKLVSTSSLIGSFRRDGFAVIPQLVSPDIVLRIRAVYDAMMDRKMGLGPAAGTRSERTIREIMMPSSQHPLFRNNAALDAGRQVARELLGVSNPVPVFDLLIYKEPGQLAETPWHQDFAYAMPDAEVGSPIPVDDHLQFWMALDDVDEANGCMHFIPSAYRLPLLEHDIRANGPQHLLAIRHPERALNLSLAIACPLKAGGATVHTHGTPHFTPGNSTSDRPRRAYVFKFAKAPVGLSPQELSPSCGQEATPDLLRLG